MSRSHLGLRSVQLFTTDWSLMSWHPFLVSIRRCHWALGTCLKFWGWLSSGVLCMLRFWPELPFAQVAAAVVGISGSVAFRLQLEPLIWRTYSADMGRWATAAQEPRASRDDLAFTKCQSFCFSHKDSGSRCWGESLPAQRGLESTQLTFLFCPCSLSSTILIRSSLHVPPFHLCVSLSPPSWLLLTLYGFFLIIICSF